MGSHSVTYTQMGDQPRVGIPPRYITSNPGNEYRPKCYDALWLGSKGRMAQCIRW